MGLVLQSHTTEIKKNIHKLAKLMICKSCQKACDTSFSFCPHCGQTLTPATQLPETQSEQTCPTCLKDDHVKSAQAIVMAQTSGFNAENFQASKLAEKIMDAVGSKPRGLFNDIAGLFDNSKHKAWEQRVERFAISYYCDRCNMIFFTEEGIKKHAELHNFSKLLRA